MLGTTLHLKMMFSGNERFFRFILHWFTTLQGFFFLYETYKFEKSALMKALPLSISSEDDAVACRLNEN